MANASRQRTERHPRERLKQAGIGLFYAKGFEATSVRDITQACGLTPGAMYNHYGSKEDLLHAIIMDGHEILSHSMGSVPVDVPVKERLHDLLRAYVLHHTRHSELAVVGDQWRSLGEEYRTQVRASRLSVRLMVEKAIRDGVAEGEFDVGHLDGGDPVRLAAMAGLDMGLRVAYWFRPGTGVTDEEFARFYADLLVRGVSTPPRG